MFTNNNLPKGEYCIVAIDAEGCLVGEACFEVIEPSAIEVDIAKSNNDCESKGAITLEVTGGSGIYTFDWADLRWH